MTKYKAEIRATFTVGFEDNGEYDLHTQALDAAEAYFAPIGSIPDMELVGSVEEAQ